MVTDNYQRIIKELDRLNQDRTAPEDFIHNVAKIADANDFTDEEQMNFYLYVTSQDTRKFEYTHLKDVVTLGDMPIDELEKINEGLTIHNVDVRQNGPKETLMLVKNMEKLVLIDKKENKYTEQMATAYCTIQKKSARKFAKKSDAGIEKNVQKGFSCPGQEDEKKESG